MENQQSFFMDSGEESKEQGKILETEPLPKLVNCDPREQVSRQATTQREYQAGYELQYPKRLQDSKSGSSESSYSRCIRLLIVYLSKPKRSSSFVLGEKIVLRRRRTASWPLFIVIAIFILALSGFMTARYDRPWSRGYHEHNLFEVADDAKLVVNNSHGKVYVHTGDYHHILVTTVTHTPRDQEHRMLVGANARMIDSRTVAVNVDGPQDEPGNIASQVDLDIIVPETASLAVHATEGVVSVENVKGNIQVDTTSGNIELDSTEGQASLTTSSGNIEASDVQLSGSSSLKASRGNVDFAGSLDPYGSYDFETGSGSTDITLPESSAFHLSTFTNDGATPIDNDFHSTSVGDGQQASVTIHTDRGHIAIHQDD